ncbi:MAG: TIGR03619 family F420-dependent LLM class oxidoreductase [Chloroflexota bacterium]|nr:TIGR03619 family F420-dependent LLM class oxidoreductase [Chloroflexota bacterium]
MEITLALPHTGKLASPQANAYAAEEAERLGYATVWVLERLLRPVGGTMPDSYANVYDPMETLAYVAAKTERVRLGTSIMDALFHVPAILARRFATLDQLSGGRVIAGLGQGYAPEEFRAANVPLSRRGAGFEEFIRAMQAAWGPDPVSFSGRFYNIPDSEINPKPVRDGGPPIIIAAMQEAAVERAGRLGFGINPLAPSWEALEAALDSFRNAARKAGHDPQELPVIVRANTAVGEEYAPEGEPPLSGSHEKVVEDLKRMRGLGVDEVFFDMNRYAVPVKEQFRLLERVRADIS